jgi:hypothetical protein
MSINTRSSCVLTCFLYWSELTVFLPQSRAAAAYADEHCTTLTAEHQRYTRTRLHALSLLCDISIGSLRLPAPEAGDFIELIPLYTRSAQTHMLFRSTLHIAVGCLVNAPLRGSIIHYKTRSSAAYPILIVNCLLNAPLQAALFSKQTPLFVVHATQLTTPYWMRY